MSGELESIRRGIDKVDTRIVKLLRKRSALVSAAGMHKKSESAVSNEARVEVVIQKVRELAIKEGVDPELVETVYRTMIGQFVIQEMAEFKERNSL